MFNAPSEGDDQFSESVTRLMKNSSRVRIIDSDVLSPQEYQNIIACCRFFIASRLHSSIIAASSSVPAINLYYVDKGRLFFEQLNMSKFSHPIERILEDNFIPQIHEQVEDIIKNRDGISKELSLQLATMSKKIVKDFKLAKQTEGSNDES